MAIESRDGAHLFYTDNPGSFSPATLWRIPVGGGPAVKIAERVDATRFDVVEGGIYYTETTGKETRLQYFDFASQRTTTLSANLGPLGPGISAAPDGRSVFYARIDSTINDLMLVEDFR